MKLSELKKRVDAYCKMGYGDIDVVIPNNKRVMGGISCTEVEFANKGIDWNASEFIISPKNKMKEM